MLTRAGPNAQKMTRMTVLQRPSNGMDTTAFTAGFAAVGRSTVSLQESRIVADAAPEDETRGDKVPCAAALSLPGGLACPCQRQSKAAVGHIQRPPIIQLIEQG